jgi:two-component system phosphate regulon response regulator PhoB
MSKKLIVIVEDDKDMADLVARRLTREDYAVETASDGPSGLDRIRSRLPDLALVDIMLPRMSGLDLLSNLRNELRTANIPVIIMTAKGEESDVVVGLTMGADDYVVKPFSLSVLVARMAAVLRRAAAETPSKGVLKIGPISIDTDRHIVTVEGEVVALTLTEFRVLVALVSARGRVLTRSQLIDRAMGVNTMVTDRTIDVHLTSLRKKLGEARDYVYTVRGIGYRLLSEEEQDHER